MFLFTFPMQNYVLRLPWWSREESACQCRGREFDPWSQCRGREFDPWSGKNAQAAGQLSLGATAAEARAPTAHALRREKPLQWEAHTATRAAPHLHHPSKWRKPAHRNEDQGTQKMWKNWKEETLKKIESQYHCDLCLIVVCAFSNHRCLPDSDGQTHLCRHPLWQAGICC